MRSRNTEETVRELNEKIKAAGITAEYKAAEINTNGKLSRELAGAVTQADFARERSYSGSGMMHKRVVQSEERTKRYWKTVQLMKPYLQQQLVADLFIKRILKAMIEKCIQLSL